MKAWADAFQRFIWRAASSFFLTYLAIEAELGVFGAMHDTRELVCTFWQVYIGAIALVWICFHLLLHRKD